MERKRLLLGVGIMLAVLLVVTTITFAGSKRSPSKDATGDGTNLYNELLEIQSSAELGGSGCKPVYVGYIAWDLTSENRTWQSATLTLYAYDNAGPGNYTFTVYPANNDTWPEGGTGADPGYDENTVLATVTADVSGASSSDMKSITFASNELGDYFLNKKGGQASVAVVMTDGCGSLSGDVKIEDREGHGGSAPTSANEPDLIFYTGQLVNGTPSPVEVKSFHAENNSTPSTPTWPIIVGLFAVVVVGIGYGVRRFNS